MTATGRSILNSVRDGVETGDAADTLVVERKRPDHPQ
jgi:hypothetical protein